MVCTSDLRHRLLAQHVPRFMDCQEDAGPPSVFTQSAKVIPVWRDPFEGLTHWLARKPDSNCLAPVFWYLPNRSPTPPRGKCAVFTPLVMEDTCFSAAPWCVGTVYLTYLPFACLASHLGAVMSEQWKEYLMSTCW